MFCKKGVLKNFSNSQENTCAEVSFNKIASLRPAALLKRDSSEGVFPWILQDFLERLFCIWLSMSYKIGVLKYLAKFTAKFMWTAAAGISKNRPCLAGSNFYPVLQYWL